MLSANYSTYLFRQRLYTPPNGIMALYKFRISIISLKNWN